MPVPPFKPVTREDGARVLSISLGTLDHMIETGVLPPLRALGGGRRLYWHPDIFYSCLDQLLRADTPPSGSLETPDPKGGSESAPSTKTRRSIDLRSVRNARHRDASSLVELNK